MRNYVLAKRCWLILLIAGAGLVDAFENDDLVFDQEGKQSFDESPLIVSHGVQESILHRIKRGFFDFFVPKTSTTRIPTTTTEALIDQNEEITEYENENAAPVEADNNEKPRASSVKKLSNFERLARDSGEKTEETDERDNEIGNVAEARREPPKFGNTDDEDLAGSGEVEGSATYGRQPEPGKEGGRYYRITLTVGEPYVAEYADRNSQQYKELSGNLTEALEDLYNRNIPSERHHANVVKISPTSSDVFTSLVTVDIGSSFTDELEVKNILEKQLQYHSLGNINVNQKEFTFRVFQAGAEEDEQECDASTELICRNGACVPLESRCDGISQCTDGSDEDNCPVVTTAPEQETKYPTFAPYDESPTEETASTEGTGNDYDDSTLRSPSNKCRADDTVRCHDGSRYICSVQQCDGMPDCDDGGDEVGCPHPGCNAGEFACDVSRCILESQRCNYIEECQDGTDEHNCNYPACTSTQFRCKNGECIDSSDHCNGIRNCHDGSDELNCPCAEDEFECTPRYCVTQTKRCDGVMDCSNGKDEENCSEMTRCRPDEFECVSNGDCVSRSARCNGRSDCLDRSDEFNCSVTTCSGDQFRCLDGTCLSIDKRCNQVIDCRNGEDENQCGCGKAEFRCADGRCIGYEFQCNGVEECSDGSDERDCEKSQWLNVYNDERIRSYAKRFKTLLDLKKCEKEEKDCEVSSMKQGLVSDAKPKRKKQQDGISRNRINHDDNSHPRAVGRRLQHYVQNDNVIANPVDAAFPELSESKSKISDMLSGTILQKLINRENEGPSLNKVDKKPDNFGRFFRKPRNSTKENTKNPTKMRKKSKKHLKKKNRKNNTNPRVLVQDSKDKVGTNPEALVAPASTTIMVDLRVPEIETSVTKHGSRFSDYFENHLNNLIKKIYTSTTPNLLSSSESEIFHGERNTFKAIEDTKESDLTVDADKQSKNVTGTVKAIAEKLVARTDEYDAEMINQVNGIKPMTEEDKYNSLDLFKSTNSVEENATQHSNSSSKEEDLDERFKSSSAFAEVATTRNLEEETSFKDSAEELTTKRSSQEDDDDNNLTTVIEKEFTKFTSKEEDVSDTPNARLLEKDDEDLKIISEDRTSEAEVPFLTEETLHDAETEDIYGYKAKKHGSLAKYFHKYLKGSVTPSFASSTSSVIDNADANLPVNLESGLFESNSWNNVEVNLQSTGRLSNELPRNSSLSTQRTFKNNVDTCTSKCREYWRKTFGLEKTKSRADIDENLNNKENVDSGLISSEGTATMDPEEHNCTDGIFDIPDSEEIFNFTSIKDKDTDWKTSHSVTTATESTNLVEVFVDLTTRKPRTDKKKPRHGKKRKNDKSKNKKKGKKSGQRDRTKESTTSGQRETTSSFDQSWNSPTWTLFAGITSFEVTSPSSEEPTKEFLSKETVDREENQTLEITVSTDLFGAEDSPATKKKGGKTTESSWWDLGFFSNQNSEEDSKNSKENVTEEPTVDLTMTSTITSISGSEEVLERNSSISEEFTCNDDQFQCDGNVCIAEDRLCDAHVDCVDASDETNCYYIPTIDHSRRNQSETKSHPASCGTYEFICDGSCISAIYSCDGFADCQDGADEAECGDTERKCTPTQFKCLTGNKCIEGVYRCDGHADCPDHSDEDCANETITHITEPTNQSWTGWSSQRPRECDPSREMRCNDGMCVQLRRKCDNIFDCIDGSDELGCGVCTPAEWKCASGECIPENERCDDTFHCADGSDETGCANECPAGMFRCNDGLCLDSKRRCDGRPHCTDGSDEINCQCPEGQQPCDNGVCINSNFFCDNNVDCHDGSDERDCPETGETNPVHYPASCRHDEFMCRDRSCIPRYAVCDGRRDCPHEDDEMNCDRGCGKDQFQCANGNCIKADQKCNGFIECADGSDESEGCDSHPTSGLCPTGYIVCTTDRNCVPQSSICNGVPECRDGSDEKDCDSSGESSYLNLKTYPSEQVIKESREVVFQCRDEGPIRARVRWLRGNNRPLPPNSRDINGRLEIPNIQLEHAGPYICEAVGQPPSIPGQQVTVHLSVEKFEPPATNRPHVCQYDEATCSNGDCIPKSYVCNGRLDCTDGSDEMRCSIHGCEPNEFRCNNTQCVGKLWRCDGDMDCADGSDEEHCAPSRPGSLCEFTEYACASGQCIPKSYHCDRERDCMDGTDEIGCSPVYIVKPPPPMITLERGETLVIVCTAIGVPTPEINWRLNWGHIPPKCTMTSVNGTGTLTCPDIQTEDQGAYSCEGLNNDGFVFAVPDAIVMVNRPGDICPKGMFNSEARTLDECISCFCFGVATECHSANLFTYQIPPPLDRHKVVNIDLYPILRVTGDVNTQALEVTALGRDSVQLYASNSIELSRDRDRSGENVPYFALPEHYHGSQLKSYGGYLKYKVRYNGTGTPNSAPSVVMSGNNYVLVHRDRQSPPNYDTERSVRFFQGEWYKQDGRDEVPATREDIMMTLARVDNILIKAQYDDSPYLDVQISNIVMDTADARNTGLGSASYVEECRCPSGYSGLSCEQCAPGYLRRKSGPWLGQCYRDEQPCPPGYYGDPSRNIPCQVCPCPLTNPSNQFARTCHLGSDGTPTCDCPPGYVGHRCERCDSGYQGNPLIPGDMCVPARQCDPDGSLSEVADPITGQCRCKHYTTGLTCNQCKANTFNLASKNQYGCISCFCMGISDRCVSSNWYRNDIRVSFTNSIRDFSLIESKIPDALPITEGIRLDTVSREIVFSNFPNRGNNDVYYWQLPSIFLGNRITSYGGDLKYTVRYVPAPGGQSSRNNAADVELISANNINLLYFSRESPEPNTPQTFTVPLLEQFWQRTDGTQADREHMLMALADVSAIRIKATYTTHTNEAALSLVFLDTADKYNTGRTRAVEVEECTCPIGYKGLSCEDCDVGYTRSDQGVYLGGCEPCNCNGHSRQCNPDTGICENCEHHTTGEFCDVCEPGYEGDATRGTPYDCVFRRRNPTHCNCNEAGSRSSTCVANRCDCKRNVEGPECNRCRPSTFGLSANNPDGCSECYCSGVTDQCHESSLYVQQIPVLIYDAKHGFTLTDSTRQEVIDEGFELNIAMNEIGYRYPDSRGRRLFWSLPPVFTGNKVKSYGGNLILTQHITAHPGAQSYKDQDIILVGNGITLFWTNPVEIQPNIPLTYTVPLRESEWRRLTMEGPRVASHVDIMTVLSNLEAILVRASHSERMAATYISDISLDTAVEHATGNRRAVQVEVCRCPMGYVGTSCESCARGYYRDTNNRSISYLGSCIQCPCNGNEESCDISRTGQVKCHCQEGYTGQYCQQTGEVMVSLTPMKIKVKPYTWTPFTCSYESLDPLYIYFNLSPFRGAPLTAHSTRPNPIVKTEKGASRTCHVYVQLEPCDVECYIQDYNKKELIKVVTSITPEDPSETTTIAPNPNVYPPKILVHIKGPELEIVKTGTTVRYHCSGRALDDGPLHVKWEKLGGQLPPGRSVDDNLGLLIIRDVKVSDSGIYVCQVSDGVHVAFKNVTLTVGGSNPVSPRAIVAPTSLQVVEGEPAEFRCEASGNPPPQVEWIRVHGAMNPEVVIHDGVWFLQRVTKNDAAEYRCLARNNVGVDEQIVILYVREYPPPRVGLPPTITPLEWTGKIGEVIRITCTPSDVANVTWTRDANLPLPRTANQRDGVLTIMNPTLYDSGIYVCTAISYLGSQTNSTITITVLPHRVPASVRVKPEMQTVPQGNTAEVRCVTGGEPGEQITWSKHHQQLNPNAQNIGDTLRIVNVQVSDRGVYICHVTGPNGNHEASAVIEVEPREAPRLELYPKDTQTVRLGGSADIQCRAIAGIPVPELRWYRQDGRPFLHNIRQLPGGILTLSNITIDDGGAYVCSAMNSVGSDSAVAYIDVQSVPVITVSPSSGILNVKRGDRVQLTCSANGIPQPNVEWTKHVDGIRESYSPVFRQDNGTPRTAVYEIYSVSDHDEGSYTCHAMNAAGVVEERVHIRIDDDNEVYPPCRGDVPCTEDNRPTHTDHDSHRVPVGPPQDYFRIPTGGKVEMRCQALASDGNHILLDWKRSDHLPLPKGSTVHNGILNIPDVDKSAAGEYVCLGMDHAGTILFKAKSHLEVLSLPRIVLKPPRQTVGPGENPSIRCSATGDEPMTIEWEAIGRSLPYSVSHDRGILQFHGITYSDAGKYVCKATNDAGTAEAVAEVLVNEHSYEDMIVRADQRDVVTYVGQPVRLRCIVRERTTIHWSREGLPLPSYARIEDDYLELPRVRPDDSGRYTCQIQTAHGVSSDYINLNVSLVNLSPDCTRANQTQCGQRKCICGVQGCVLMDYSCFVDIQYFNGNTDYSNDIPQSRHYLQQRRATVMQPAVSVEVSQDPVNIGDTIDIRCACTGTRNPRYHWSRPNHPSLPPNSQEYENVLRLTSVTVDDSGYYRCTAETSEGIFERDFNLVVHGKIKGGHNDAPAIETKYAPYGSSVEMNCRPNLDSPDKFQWSKLGGLLPRDAHTFESKLNLTNVKAEDAGTYICTVNNDHESIEIPTVLVVTGVVPYFSQAPESFIALPPLPDCYLKFNIEVSFKPESYDGIILYNDEGNRGDGDFIMLSLMRGYPQFSFNLGSGPTVIQADKPVSLSEWHTVKLQRDRKEGTMLVDGEGPYKGTATGRKQGLDLKELMFVGGVPNYNIINKNAEMTTGFVGCISRLVIGEKEVDLNGNQADSIGITNCETCAENPCNNGGVCQEAATKNGYTCLCRADYSGKHCDNVGQSCFPGACGEGNCVDKETGFECYCPYGKTGQRCEKSMKIYEPAFHDDKSFIAHNTPKALRRTRMSTTHNRLQSRNAQVRSRPHHHNNLHHTKH
ncbi:basement membrane-specific heparan sulfate proteoglycan core protein-like isoform X1 [Hylaeus volcanicus]|uniref:basement membrane-specific heparan sulfate proteoglycan core protein-like isoform X1 n=1 Tax=Hylaeus volcanicus TaxID=313075 RepID=UPI0023B77624|nr:basement membrane-specific heparan sulfate proteoglycan core protein-like isoform X1 [Hylaeus volcanicus]